MSAMVVEPKPGLDVGRVVVDMQVENADDLSLVAASVRTVEQVRKLEVKALVDTGATMVSLPAADIAALGLRPVRQRPVRTALGPGVQQVYSPVRITVENRQCLVEVAGLPAGCPAFLGQVPLELLDFWIDMTQRRLVGNPEHGGEWMADEF
jgi:predicted aspartyl protease